MAPSDVPDPLNPDRLRQVFEDTPAAVAVFDTHLRLRYVNEALARMNGIPAADHVGLRVDELLPAVDIRQDLIRLVLDDGVPREATASGHTWVVSGQETRYWLAVYHRVECDGEPWGVACVALEVTASRLAQRELERARERLALLDAAVGRIGTTLEVETTCAELAEFLVPLLADLVTVDVFPPDDPDPTRAEVGTGRAASGGDPGGADPGGASGGAASGADPGVAPGADPGGVASGPSSGLPGPARAVDPGRALRLRRAALAAVPPLRERARGLGEPGTHIRFQPGSQMSRTLSTGAAAILNLPTDDEMARAGPEPERVALYRAMGLHSAVMLPLTSRGTVLGALTMARGGRRPSFTHDDLTVAEDLAGRAAISLDNARRYTREHGIARELQRALLSAPQQAHPGIEVATRYLAAGSSAVVGGDWYDTIHRSSGRTLLAMGDVMGHGVEAAVDMSNYRSMLRVVGAADLPPHRVLRRMDAMIAESPDNRPATCLLMLADPGRGTLSYSRAGHLPPALLGADGVPRLLTGPAGPPLGTGYGGYETVTVDWPPGTAALLYTDGLVEHRDEDIDASLDRLTALRLPPRGDLEALVDRLLAELGGAAEDDVAVLAARAIAVVAPHAA